MEIMFTCFIEQLVSINSISQGLAMHAAPMDLVSRGKMKLLLNRPEGYEKYGIEDPRLVTIDNQIYFSYVVLSDYVPKVPVCSTALATTNS